jgi:hypothetical protein
VFACMHVHGPNWSVQCGQLLLLLLALLHTL